MAKKQTQNSSFCENRAAFHNFEILEMYEAGISLVGTEVKAVQDGGASINEAFIRIEKNEAFIKLAYIPHYKFGNVHNHEERRDRKLLLHKWEIEKLRRSVQLKGLTIVPLSIYPKKGKIKLKIGLAKGKKLHDKRVAIKERDEKRRVMRAFKDGD
ncbi:MAG: SsrA-binding protein [Chlamydiia bacterium]|nr:SsrA-binding protein [Chlamydiia bacterium]